MNATQATAHSATGVQFQRVVGALVAAGGALTMAERAFGLPEWIHLVPCGAGIKAIAALAFLFTGCALILLTIPGARARNAAQICVLAAGGIGLFMLVGYAAGQTFQIAELPLGKPTSPAAAAQTH